ncbi:hypothetical protein M440DRAFT_1389519 [Trichoderma longibrachiatum ATCC 18648]|uniref:Uncharacterized protein n=1 Tax=Trichoderma longibrachiatum ATCC 18648 TaxID=983965 RepID=A0A2T4CDD5_TRILO|nr:hypothetical protein M440DRAFT_1389519 [Trichoderma longibrachiatum ATCC 18648]
MPKLSDDIDIATQKSATGKKRRRHSPRLIESIISSYIEISSFIEASAAAALLTRMDAFSGHQAYSDSSDEEDGDEQDNEDDDEQDNERDSEHDDKYSGADIDSYVVMSWLFHVDALEQLQTSDGEISRLLSQFLGVDRSPQQSSWRFQRWPQLVYGTMLRHQWLPTHYKKSYSNFQSDENPIFFICAVGLYHTMRDYWASKVDVSPVNESPEMSFQWPYIMAI